MHGAALIKQTHGTGESMTWIEAWALTLWRLRLQPPDKSRPKCKTVWSSAPSSIRSLSKFYKCRSFTFMSEAVVLLYKVHDPNRRKRKYGLLLVLALCAGFTHFCCVLATFEQSFNPFGQLQKYKCVFCLVVVLTWLCGGRGMVLSSNSLKKLLHLSQFQRYR